VGKILCYDKEYACGFELTLELISGKWKGMILWYLQDETLRYNELRKKLGKITQKMLTQTLRDLEKDQLITRKVYPVVPPKVEYTITQRGKKLIPIFKELREWGEEVALSDGEIIE
jgi:DNA-binding HxlR family transcriptional regulator